jgi:hypothetical protein
LFCEEKQCAFQALLKISYHVYFAHCKYNK